MQPWTCQASWLKGTVIACTSNEALLTLCLKPLANNMPSALHCIALHQKPHLDAETRLQACVCPLPHPQSPGL